MKKILLQHHISFRNAFSGVSWALRTQPNFRIHLVISFIAVCLGFYLELEANEWAIILFTIILGLSAEMINTSLEAMTDLITTEWRQQAKIAKDVAAGMMLTVACGAVVVGVIIFGPKLLILAGIY